MSALTTTSQIESFLDKGYTVLRSEITKEQCEEFLTNSVLPAVKTHSSYIENNPDTFSDIPGDMVRDRTTVEGKQLDPIPASADGRWGALFNDRVLPTFLDALHGETGGWEWLHDDNVGWIHIRFPNFTAPSAHDKPLSTAPERPFDGGSWHVDGAHFNPHKLTSLEQSIIVLPMLRDVAFAGGNTIILRNSHKDVINFLHAAGPNGVSDRRLNEFACYLVMTADTSRFEEVAPCAPGDLLIMHPFVVHSSSRNTKGNPWRISFNMGARWSDNKIRKHSPLVRHFSSVLSTSTHNNKIYYNRPVFIRGLDRNSYLTSSRDSLAVETRLDKDDRSCEFRFEFFEGDDLNINSYQLEINK